MKSAVAFVMVLCLSCWAAAAEKPITRPATAVVSSQPALITLAPNSEPANAPVTSSVALVAPLVPVEAPAVLTRIGPRRAESTHRFFDVKNGFGFAALAAGLTGDALSTQKGLGLPGYHEMNPIARPFVQTRPGAALYSAASFALMGSSMYLAHHTNHHKLERIMPFVIAGWEGFLTVRNYHLISNPTKTR